VSWRAARATVGITGWRGTWNVEPTGCNPREHGTERGMGARVPDQMSMGGVAAPGDVGCAYCYRRGKQKPRANDLSDCAVGQGSRWGIRPHAYRPRLAL